MSTDQVDYLDPHDAGAGDGNGGRGKRRTGVAVAAGVGIAALVGGGAWGLTQALGGGSDPASAVPADAFAYLAVDLDPGAGQQLEAYQTMKKFPGLDEELSLSGTGDLKESLLERLLAESGCEGLDYGEDIAPWLGDSLAVAVRPGEDEPVPFGVVEVTDGAAAEDGITALEECSGSQEPTGTALAGDYLVLAEDTATAEQVVADAEAGSLADATDFQDRVEEVGGVGFVTGYASAATADELRRAMEAELSQAGGPGMPDPDQLFEDYVGSFGGAAMSLRFEDEAAALRVAGDWDAFGIAPGEGDAGVGDLPGTTTVAAGFPVPEDFGESAESYYRDLLGDELVDDALGSAEELTGLDLPADLTAAFGDGVALAVDGSLDPAALDAAGPDAMGDLPAGLRILGDPATVAPAVEKLLAAAAAPPDLVTVAEGDGVVAVAFDPDYAEELVGDGDLAEQAAFSDAVGDVGSGDSVFFADFDADWLQEAVEMTDDPDADKVAANLEPLAALGMRGSQRDGAFSFTLRLTTD